MDGGFAFYFLGVLGTAVFVVYPMIRNIIISFQDYSIMPNAENPFVGFENYISAFTDPNNKVLMAIRNTILNVIVTVPINWLLAIVFAVLINLHFVKYKLVFRTVYYLPIITSWIVVAFLFRFLFAGGEYGLINFIFYKVLGIFPELTNFLSNYWTAMIVIWLFHIWKTVGWGLSYIWRVFRGYRKNIMRPPKSTVRAESNSFGALRCPCSRK